MGAIGIGLLTTLLPNSSTGDWVGFELLTGLRGMALQIVRFPIPSFGWSGHCPPCFNSNHSQNSANQFILASQL
jgi:hypothetical protein